MDAFDKLFGKSSVVHTRKDAQLGEGCICVFAVGGTILLGGVL